LHHCGRSRYEGHRRRRKAACSERARGSTSASPRSHHSRGATPVVRRFRAVRHSSGCDGRGGEDTARAGAARRGRRSPPRPSLMPAASVDARRALAFSHHTYALLPHATALDDVKSALFSRGPCTRALSGVEISIISESHLARPAHPAHPQHTLPSAWPGVSN